MCTTIETSVPTRDAVVIISSHSLHGELFVTESVSRCRVADAEFDGLMVRKQE